MPVHFQDRGDAYEALQTRIIAGSIRASFLKRTRKSSGFLYFFTTESLKIKLRGAMNYFFVFRGLKSGFLQIVQMKSA